MNLKNSLRKNTEPHTSALNDILFILLFFFLIISTLANPNVVKLSIPKASSDTKSKQTIMVSIDSLQQLYVGTQMINKDSLKNSMQSALMLSSDIDPTVVINADKNANADNIVWVMKTARILKLKTVLAVDNN
ncbi:MAG: biopolymer transporter ExbD [Chitinophagia bacterium]|nr:biopolymer transporter ExbD [Chitinophagia bacterium]